MTVFYHWYDVLPIAFLAVIVTVIVVTWRAVRRGFMRGLRGPGGNTP